MKKIKKIEDNIIKYVRNLMLKKEIDDNTIKDIRNLFKLIKENEEMNNRIIRDISNLFEMVEEDCYKPARVGNFYSKNYIEYEI